jgi:hypothetical protein
MTDPTSHSALPQFDVHLKPPDIAPWKAGDAGIPGFITRRSREPGPHVALLGLMHGNELAGAIVLDRLLRAGLQPARGALTFGFVNVEAFERFDVKRPTASRFIDEDLNRVWDTTVLDGPRHSRELDRAREIRPLIDTVDVLLDLHSMLWPSDPLVLSGTTEKGRALALGTGSPALVVADQGHANGRRLIDYRLFSDHCSHAAANLLEGGQHWEAATVDTMMKSVSGLLHHLGILPVGFPALPPPPRVPQRVAEVTTAVTARTAEFSFVQPYRGGEVIPRRNTLIALDGTMEIRTPYDDCLLVMPSLRPSRGHTAVRMARFV